MVVLGIWNYWVVAILLLGGLYITLSSNNLIKKLAGLSIFQTAVIVFYISLAKVKDGSAPIVKEGIEIYDNPLPHVLMLTAIVVGVATTAVGLALVIKIYNLHHTIEEDEIIAQIRTAPIESLPIKKHTHNTSKRKYANDINSANTDKNN